jgi:hypothetical protein
MYLEDLIFLLRGGCKFCYFQAFGWALACRQALAWCMLIPHLNFEVFINSGKVQ